MIIREAGLEDMAVAAGIMITSFRAAFARFVSQETMDACTNPENCRHMLEHAFREGRMRFLMGGDQGFLCWQETGEGSEIVAIHSLPESWGTGLGHEMLTEALRRMKTRPVYLWAFQENARARRFYEKHGFRWDGTKRISEFDGAAEVRYVYDQLLRSGEGPRNHSERMRKMNILVSGLVNTETTAAVRGFPIAYYPIDYTFFGVDTAVSGVAYNIARALTVLGDEVRLNTMTGQDFAAGYIREALGELGIGTEFVKPKLRQTPSSVVLYDPDGKRQIYCDLKDIQQTPCEFDEAALEGVDLVVACNINFNRPLLHLAKRAGKTIATDVHVLSDIHDEYNREFMEQADILFLSDEGVGEDWRGFLLRLAQTYPSRIIVMGRGAKGAAMYLRETGEITEMPASSVGAVVNTVGAGDALFSGFLHFYARQLAPVEALRRAQVFASYKIMVSGASKGFVTEQTVEDWLEDRNR